MQKLVSKNTVLRFKEGKKIVKAEDGLAVGQYYYQAPSGSILIGSGPTNKYRTRLTNRYKFKRKDGTYGYMGSFDEGKTYYDLDSKKLLANASNYVNSYYKKKSENLQKLQTLGSTEEKPTPITIVKPKQRSGWSYGFDRSKEGIGDIATMLRKLKAEGYYADDENSADDGKWGLSTENAYLRYLNKLKAMELPPEVVVTPKKIEENITDHPPVQYTPNFGYKTNNTYEGNDFSNRMKSMGIRSNADLIDFMYRNNAEGSTFNGDTWAKQFHSDVNRALGGDYSDANIRKVFGTSGRWGKGFLGRGDFGDFQNALQTNAGMWNGRYNNRFAQNLGWMLLRKQGGQLVSRNPIIRFKNKKK